MYIHLPLSFVSINNSFLHSAEGSAVNDNFHNKDDLDSLRIVTISFVQIKKSQLLRLLYFLFLEKLFTNRMAYNSTA